MIVSKTRMVLGLVVLIIHCTYITDTAQGQKATNAEEVLAKMLATYENAQSYEDVGEMRLLQNAKTILSEPRGSKQFKIMVSFQIHFEKPQLFRFDWRNGLTKTSRESVIWSDGQEHYIWAPDRVTPDDRFNLERKKGFDYLIDRVVKPSNGTILPIPGLLIPTLRRYSFADVARHLSEVKIIKEAFVDGEMCYVVSAKASNDPWVFWIGKSSFLLRKMRSVLATGSFDPEKENRHKPKRAIAEEIHRKIRINEKLDEGVFHYKPQILPRDTDLTKYTP